MLNDALYHDWYVDLNQVLEQKTLIDKLNSIPPPAFMKRQGNNKSFETWVKVESKQ